MKIEFNTYDNLPLNKQLKLHMLAIIVRCIFQEEGKCYPQLYLDDCLSVYMSWKQHINGRIQ